MARGKSEEYNEKGSPGPAPGETRSVNSCPKVPRLSDALKVAASYPAGSWDTTFDYDTTNSLGTYVFEFAVDVHNVVGDLSEADNLRLAVLEVQPNDAPPAANGAPVFNSVAVTAASVGTVRSRSGERACRPDLATIAATTSGSTRRT